MDSLLCDEDILRSPFSPEFPWEDRYCDLPASDSAEAIEREDCEDTFRMYLKKEASYMPASGYAERLREKGLVDGRFKAINWMAQLHERLNLSWATIFDAINFMDRFISLNLSEKLNGWMMELLSVGCLSIAAKLEDVEVPPLRELQDGLDHEFHPKQIQRMELSVSVSLEWRLKALTAYSLTEPLVGCLNVGSPLTRHSLSTRLAKILLNAFADVRFLHFWPCGLAVAALRCGLDEVLPLKSSMLMATLDLLIPPERKRDADCCFELLEKRMEDCTASLYTRSCVPWSPVSVLTMGRVKAMDSWIDFSLWSSSPLPPCATPPTKPKRQKKQEVRDREFGPPLPPT